MLSVPDYPIKIKAFAAQAICIILHDDQGIKAKWNSKVIAMLDDIRNKLIHGLNKVLCFVRLFIRMLD